MRANIAVTYNEIGTLSVRLYRYREALVAYDEALIHLVGGFKREQRDAYIGMSEAHEALGDLGAALGALKKCAKSKPHSPTKRRAIPSSAANSRYRCAAFQMSGSASQKRMR